MDWIKHFALHFWYFGKLYYIYCCFLYSMLSIEIKINEFGNILKGKEIFLWAFLFYAYVKTFRLLVKRRQKKSTRKIHYKRNFLRRSAFIDILYIIIFNGSFGIASLESNFLLLIFILHSIKLIMLALLSLLEIIILSLF